MASQREKEGRVALFYFFLSLFSWQTLYCIAWPPGISLSIQLPLILLSPEKSSDTRFLSFLTLFVLPSLFMQKCLMSMSMKQQVGLSDMHVWIASKNNKKPRRERIASSLRKRIRQRKQRRPTDKRIPGFILPRDCCRSTTWLERACCSRVKFVPDDFVTTSTREKLHSLGLICMRIVQ